MFLCHFQHLLCMAFRVRVIRGQLIKMEDLVHVVILIYIFTGLVLSACHHLEETRFRCSTFSISQLVTRWMTTIQLVTKWTMTTFQVVPHTLLEKTQIKCSALVCVCMDFHQHHFFHIYICKFRVAMYWNRKCVAEKTFA